MQIDWLLTEQYPTAEKIVLVMDNLNTHTTASLYATFPPEQARKLAERLEIHYTPKHGSWLDRAEIELSALGRLLLLATGFLTFPHCAACLNRGRLRETLCRKVLTGSLPLVRQELS